MKLQHFLLTALILFTSVSGVYATKRYVGFTSGGTYSNAELQTALNEAETGKDTVCVATGLYLADAAEFTVPQGVTLIGGYNKGSITTPRRYPGEFVPFNSSVVDTTQFTILDGNSYKRSLASQKHRVVTVKNNGVVDGCLIRNGHVRNKNGGGVLLDGGKLYNSIVRGNVAMNHPDSAEALGGGVFIQQGGELINCLVAYNMANDGYGVAAGTGGGKMINNTITANTYAPVFAKIPAITGFRMYASPVHVKFRPADDVLLKYDAQIKLSEFYISRILTTEGQFAVFCAAMDISKSSSNGQLNVATLKGLTDPIKGGTVGTRYGFTDANLQTILQANTNVDYPGLNYGDGIWYPTGDTATVEYPMGFVSWYGALAYSVWLGGGLPTEAQWQFAARCNSDGTASDNLYSGAYGSPYTISGGKDDNNDTAMWRILDTIAWVNKSVSIDTTSGAHFGKMPAQWTNRVHEVARKRPNDMGIYDMTGNIKEWCGDYNPTAAAPSYSGSGTPTDPMDIGQGSRSIKGGSFDSDQRTNFSLTLHMYSSFPTATGDVGFRPVVAF